MKTFWYFPLLILFSFLIFWGEWLFLFLGVLAIIFFYLIFKNTTFALIFVLGISPITRFPGFFEYVEPIKNIIYISVLVCWLIKERRSLREWLRTFKFRNPWQRFVIFFSLLILVNCLFSSHLALSFNFAFSHLINLCFIFLFTNYLSKQDDASLRKIMTVFILIAVFVSSLALLQYSVVEFGILSPLKNLIIPAVHRDVLTSSAATPFLAGSYRSWGTFHHPNLLGIYLAMVFPICLVVAFTARLTKERFLFFLSSLLILGGVFCAGSRGALVDIFIASSFLLLFLKRKISIWILVAAILSLPVLAMREPTDHFRWKTGIPSRILMWENAVQLFKEQPFIGSGLGTFPDQYLNRFGFPSRVDFETVLSELKVTGTFVSAKNFNAHNLFLNYAVEMGLFSLAVLFYFYFQYFKEGLLFLRTHKNSDHVNVLMMAGCFASILGNFVHSFFEASTNFYYLPLGILFVFIFSLSLSLMGRSKLAYGQSKNF